MLRLLKFYAHYDQRFNFLILDSSSDDLNDNDLTNYLERENVEYKKFDPEIFFIDKIADGSSFITTPFTALCADDDFLIPTGILESRKFLIENTNYTSAHGLYFNHTCAKEAQKNGFTIDPLYQNGQSAEQGTGKERMNAYLSGKTIYNPMYAVHRTDLFQSIWAETKTYVSDWGLSELFPCSLSFIYGKMKVLPVFYASREPNTFTWFNENRHRDMYSIEKINRASRGLGKHLSIVDELNEDDGFTATHDALDVYLNRIGKKISQSSNNQRNWIKSKWSRLRKRIGIRTRIRKTFLQGRHRSISSQYLDDYNQVKRSVMYGNITQEELNKSRRQYSIQGL